MNPDTVLLERFVAQRDPEAFADLMRRHAGLVYGTCRRVLGDAHAAEDASQDCFLALARHASQVRGNLIGWLHTTAMRSALRRRPTVSLTTADVESIAAPELDRERDDMLRRLDQALDALPADLHEVLVLRFLEGLPQEAIATRLGCSQPTIHRRIERGLARLRQVLAPDEARSAALGVALGAALVEPPAQFLHGLGRIALTAPAVAGPVTATVTVGMGTWLTIAAAGLLTVGIATTSFWSSPATGSMLVATPPAIASVAVEPQPQPIPAFIITPRGSDAGEAFAELRRKGGPRVIALGRIRSWTNASYGAQEFARLVVPVARRFKPIAGRDLITAVAATQNLSIAWVRGGTIAVLYAGSTEAEIERLRLDLASIEAGQRGEAAWRAGWLEDPRAVSLLVSAARDADLAVARQALASLQRLSWAAVAALDVRSHDLIHLECRSQRSAVRISAMAGLSVLGGDKALIILEKALASNLPNERRAAADSLGNVGGDKALALLEKALTDHNTHVRWQATQALGIVGGDKALAWLGKALTDRDVRTRRNAVYVLGSVGGDKALALLKKALADHDFGVRWSAVSALGKLGNDQALPLLEKALADPDSSLRRAAATALGNLGGDQVLALLEKALADPIVTVRQSAAYALGRVGGDKAHALLELLPAGMRPPVVGVDKSLVQLGKELSHPDANVRRLAVNALGRLGGDQVLGWLEQALADKDANVRQAAAIELGGIGGDKALALLEKALADPNNYWYVTSQLGMAGGNKALTILEKALAHQDAMVRSSVVMALGSVGGDRALTLLDQTLADQDVSVRMSVVSALRNFVGSDKAPVLLEKALTDKDARVRSSAALALGFEGGEKGLLMLEQAIKDQDFYVRIAVISSLPSVDGDQALVFLERALSDHDLTVRMTAAQTLGHLGCSQALVLLEKLLADQDARMRNTAVQTLGTLFGDKVVALLEKALADHDASVRISAVYSLGKVGGGKTLALLEKALADQDASMRRVAAWALGTLGGDEALALLAKTLADQDDQVRRSAADALGRMEGYGQWH